MKLTIVVLLLALMPLALAQQTNNSTNISFPGNQTEDNEVLVIIITSPENQAELNSSNITLSAQINKVGNLSFKLDEENSTIACSECLNFTANLTNLIDGDHTIAVRGETSNESVTASVNFTINTTSINDNLEVIILEPHNQQKLNTTNITVSAEMNKEGSMLYKIDDSNFTLACTECSMFSTQITNIQDGQHGLSVMGMANTETIIESILFFINTTLPSGTNNSIPPIGNESNESDGNRNKFSLGFQKLPKQFAAGQISQEELTEIILNNRLNPGIINRLAKTGSLSQENIEAIINTQFLPPGILNKLLNLIGFSRNINLEEFIENTKLTDEQFSALVEKNEIPKNTALMLANNFELEEKTINSLIKKNKKALPSLIEKQTLSQKNIKKILESKPSQKTIEELTEKQILDEENIDYVIETSTNKQVVITKQKLTDRQKKSLKVFEEKPTITKTGPTIGKKEEKTDPKKGIQETKSTGSNNKESKESEKKTTGDEHKVDKNGDADKGNSISRSSTKETQNKGPENKDQNGNGDKSSSNNGKGKGKNK